MPRPGFYPPLLGARAAALLAPPSHLTREAKRLWREVVGSVPNGHFLPSDGPLLEDYVQTVLELRAASRDLAEHGRVGPDGGRSAYLLARADLARHQVTLAVQLKLSPRSRADGRKKPATPAAGDRDLQVLRGER